MGLQGSQQVKDKSNCGVNFFWGQKKALQKKLCDKDIAERSGELSGLKTLVLLGTDPVTPSNCSENSLALFVRFFGFVSSSWLLILGIQKSMSWDFLAIFVCLCVCVSFPRRNWNTHKNLLNPAQSLGNPAELFMFSGFSQRVLNGGVGSVGRWICKFGAPHFFPNSRENACFKGIWGKFEAKMGRPKFADPTPHGSNPPLKTLWFSLRNQLE